MRHFVSTDVEHEFHPLRVLAVATDERVRVEERRTRRDDNT